MPVCNLSVTCLSLFGMAKASRDKGKRGELEVAHLFTENGLPAKRTAQLQAGGWSDEEGVCDVADVTAVLAPDLYVEVKRQETLRLPTWTRQAEANCPEDRTPIIAYRQNRQPWSARVCLVWLVRKLARLHELEARVEELEAELNKYAAAMFRGPGPA